MSQKTIGFIGGGRITRIMLEGWKKSGNMPQQVVVSDINSDVLEDLKKRFPEIETAANDNAAAAAQELVFLALHPPVLKEGVAQIASVLKAEAIVISLVPKFSMTVLSELLGGFQRLIRMIPNAPSVVNNGYNPVSFSSAISATEKDSLFKLFGDLGACPEVPEHTLEAYAIITAMGPTYLWFQFQVLQELGKSFGLEEHAIKEAMAAMLGGAVSTMYTDGLSPAEVMDLIPVKPLGEHEEAIRDMYRTKLKGLFRKLTA